METTELIQRRNSNAMIAPKIEQALNDQIVMEARSSFLYLAMASWADNKGFEGTAKFLYMHAAEEREHMMRLVHFINGLGGHAKVPEIVGIPHEFDTLPGIFDSILEHEIKVTTAINDLADLCHSSKDYSTFNFLQWYLAEQQEEEQLFSGIVDKFNIIGDSGLALFEMDNFLRNYSPEEKEAEGEK